MEVIFLPCRPPPHYMCKHSCLGNDIHKSLPLLFRILRTTIIFIEYTRKRPYVRNYETIGRFSIKMGIHKNYALIEEIHYN